MSQGEGGGRPREFDREQVAINLIKWAQNHDSINLNKFCVTHDPIIPPSTLLRWVKEDEKFRESYEVAKACLGARREEWLNSEQLHVKAYDLNATNYDLFMRDEKRQQAEFESALKQKEDNNKPTSYTIVVPNDLAIGSNVSAPKLSAKPAKSAKQRN